MKTIGLWWLRVLVAVASLAMSDEGWAQDDVSECPAGGVSWTVENLTQCLADVTKQIEAAAPKSAAKVRLLARRAQLRQHLGSMKMDGPRLPQADVDAALADYAAALEIAPEDTAVRYDRARLLLRVERHEDVLKDAEILVAQAPDSVDYQTIKGDALAMLKRHPEAIEVFTRAISLAQSCAEGSAIQREVNGIRHAFDPGPQTKEEALKEIEKMRERPLYDVPEAAVVGMGFPCAPNVRNKFDDLVVMKSALFARRGDSRRALGDKHAALRDIEYAVLISSLREFSSLALCALEVEMQLDYSATENCRRVFDFNTYPILVDAERAAKIGEYLLEDGDLKGACRIALPFAPDTNMRVYLTHPKIKALRKRVRGALKGAGLTKCEIDFGRPPATGK